MSIIQIVMLGIIAGILSMVLKEQKSELSLMIILATGIIIFILIFQKIAPILELLNDLSTKAHIDKLYLNIILKIIGIAYITEFAAQTLKDANESSIASRVEFGGKVVILLQAVPIIISLVNLVLTIMQ